MARKSLSPARITYRSAWTPSCLAFFSTSSATPFGPVVPSSKTAIFFALRSSTAKMVPAGPWASSRAHTRFVFLSPRSVTFGLVHPGLIRTRLLRSSTSETGMHVTLVMPHTAPRTAASAATFSAAATPTCGFPWSSASRTSIFLPRTPPFLFHSSAASLTAFATSCPCLASGPVRGTPAAIFTACCASTAGATVQSPSATATAHTLLSSDVRRVIPSSFGRLEVSGDTRSDAKSPHYGGAPAPESRGPTSP